MKAVIYVRTNEGIFVKQVEACEAYAENLGLKVTATYADIGSGTADNRPQLRKMLAEAERGKFGAVIIFGADRLTRNMHDYKFYRHKLEKCGVKLLSATGVEL
jgi:DNA invertase Pin-like site-specific DNA recombinase